MSPSDSLTFNVRAASRHPQQHQGYDPDFHRYKPEYITPRTWRLWLCPTAETAALPDIDRYLWTVSEATGDFHRRIAVDGTAENIIEMPVDVPRPGRYHVELTAEDVNGRRYSASQDFHLRDFLVVSMGDSYACGEGNPDREASHSPVGREQCRAKLLSKIFKEKAQMPVVTVRDASWQEQFAHRSYCSGPARAAYALEDLEQGRVVTFMTFARSGAAIDLGMLGPRESDFSPLGEVDEARQTIGRREIDALVLSIGGNDVGFSTRIINLVEEDLFMLGPGLLGDEDLNRKQELRAAWNRLQDLPDKFDRLAKALKALNCRHIFITEYPIAHFDQIADDGTVVVQSGCGIFDDPGMEIDSRDAYLMKEMGKRLNAAIKDAAEKHGWTFIEGIADDFSGHGLCSDDSYFVDAELSCLRQGDFDGTLHPNEKGHDVYRRHITRAIGEHLHTLEPASP